jgi:hypothetical protein
MATFKPRAIVACYRPCRSRKKLLIEGVFEDKLTWDEAKVLQRPLADEALKIVRVGPDKKDAV